MAGEIRWRPRILVVGLGNVLMSDDGVGVHACRLWRGEGKPRFHYLVAEVGTAIGAAGHLFQWADFVVAIDAVQAGGQAGTIYRLALEELSGSSQPSLSLHDFSLAQVLRASPNQRLRPGVILGVEPASIAPGTCLSPVVGQALPIIVHQARQMVELWLSKSIKAVLD